MAWAVVIGLAVATWLGLRFAGRMPRSTYEMIGATLALALAGYTWQGSPGLPGKPTPPPVEAKQGDTAFAVLRPLFMERLGRAAEILDAADAMHRQGLEAYGIALIRAGLQKMPNNADLWVGLGNAFTQYGGGVVSPAARHAYDRAAALSPSHPAPGFFLGLAYAEAGQLAEAEAEWKALLARAPADARWRTDLERQVLLIGEARAASGR